MSTMESDKCVDFLDKIVSQFLYYRKPCLELVLQSKRLLCGQQNAGKSFNEAFKRIQDLYGAKTLSEKEARDCWTRSNKTKPTPLNRYKCEPRSIELRRCIFNELPYYDGECIPNIRWHLAATRVINGRYVYWPMQRGLSIAVLDLFHNKTT